MTTQEFITKANLTRTNTNNAWGFGGSVSKYYELGDLILRKAKFSYRQAPSHSETIFYKINELGNRVEVSKKEFENLIKDL